MPIKSSKFITNGATSSGFVKGDGTIDTQGYLPDDVGITGTYELGDGTILTVWKGLITGIVSTASSSSSSSSSSSEEYSSLSESSSSSSSIDSSSSSSFGGFPTEVYATGFEDSTGGFNANSDANGCYTFNGYNDGHPNYYNGNFYLYYYPGISSWAIETTIDTSGPPEYYNGHDGPYPDPDRNRWWDVATFTEGASANTEGDACP